MSPCHRSIGSLASNEMKGPSGPPAAHRSPGTQVHIQGGSFDVSPVGFLGFEQLDEDWNGAAAILNAKGQGAFESVQGNRLERSFVLAFMPNEPNEALLAVSLALAAYGAGADGDLAHCPGRGARRARPAVGRDTGSCRPRLRPLSSSGATS